jgi:hypothetical protein
MRVDHPFYSPDAIGDFIQGLKLGGGVDKFTESVPEYLQTNFYDEEGYQQGGKGVEYVPGRLDACSSHAQEPWKMPLRQYIQHLYFKRFGKERPDEIPSIEEKIRSEEEKKSRRREAKLQGILAKANKQELDDA